MKKEKKMTKSFGFESMCVCVCVEEGEEEE